MPATVVAGRVAVGLGVRDADGEGVTLGVAVGVGVLDGLDTPGLGVT
jgi:hypothetical protein